MDATALNELLAPTYLISFDEALPAMQGLDGVIASEQLNTGLLDLSSLAWVDVCEFIHQHNNTESSINTSSHSTSDQSIDQINSLEVNNDRNVDEASRFIDSEADLNMLDFEISADVLMTLNQLENLNTSSGTSSTVAISDAITSVASFMQAEDLSPSAAVYSSPLNSPSAEQSYSNLDYLSSSSCMGNANHIQKPSPMVVLDEISMPSSVATSTDSPASPRLRRTRTRTIDKRESNKVAAIKYRTKKMRERELLFTECEEYERRNNELRRKIDDTQTEISFIKSLLVEALIAKNTKK